MIDALDMGTGRALTGYLRHLGHGLFFDPTPNHDAWLPPAPLPAQVVAFVDDFLHALEARFPEVPQGDAAAETLQVGADEVEAFREQIEQKSYAVAVRLRRSRPEAARRRPSLGRSRPTMNVGARSLVSRPRISS